jgi:hypothetical protein
MTTIDPKLRKALTGISGILRLHHHQRDCRQDKANHHQRKQRPRHDCTIHRMPRVNVG